GYSYLTGDTGYHAFLVTPVNGTYFQDANLDGRNDLMTDLATVGGAFSDAADINASGQVVGYESDPNSGYVHAVLWQDGAKIDLGTLGGSYGAATAINDAGQVVGYAGVNLVVGYAGYWTDAGYWDPIVDDFGNVIDYV